MKNSLTTTKVAQMLGVTSQTIANWIDRGKLRAERTVGGHRRVMPQDLMAFLASQGMSIPGELVDCQHTLLVVEDDPQVGPWLVSRIAAARPDLRILLAQDGFTAGELVASERPATVILDIYLPGIDGFEVCRRIKGRIETAGSTVIAVTAHANDDIRDEILEAGAVTCLAKPIDVDVLLTLIHEHLPTMAR